MKFGIDRLISDPELRAALKGRRVALLGHPASVTEDLTHSLDALMACDDLNVTAAFGPQHGMRGDLQDNMMETPDETDPRLGIPVFSLYGEVRRPTGQRWGRSTCCWSTCRRWVPHLHLHHHPAVRTRGGGGARQDGVGAGPAQSRPGGRSRG